MAFRSPPSLIQDGPEYSQISDDTRETTWYAAGLPDPVVEAEAEAEQGFPTPKVYQQFTVSPGIEPAEGEDGTPGAAVTGASGTGVSPTGQRKQGIGRLSAQFRGSYNIKDGTFTRHHSGNTPLTSPISSDPASPPPPPPSQPTGAANFFPTSAEAASIMPTSTPISSRSPIDPDNWPLSPSAMVAAEAERRATSSSGRPDNYLVACLKRFVWRWGQAVTCAWSYVGSVLILALWFVVFACCTFYLTKRLKANIQQSVMITPKPSFLKPKARVRLDVYFYNHSRLCHPDSYATPTTGTPPGEIGPYSYTVHSKKTDVQWHPENSTVSYRVKTSYVFQRNVSTVTENDVIHTLDLNRLTRTAADNRAGKPYPREDELSPFIQPQTVSRLLWGSFKSAGLLRRREHRHIGMSHWADPMPIHSVVSPMYNVYTGADQASRLNEVFSYNYTVQPKVWSSNKDDQLHSGVADGDFFPAFVDTSSHFMFYSQLARTVPLEFVRPVEVKGHAAYRFQIPTQQVVDPTPDNQTDSEMSWVDLNATTRGEGEAMGEEILTKDGPLVLSMPHPDEYPNTTACRQHLDIHQVSGITMRKRLCFKMSTPVDDLCQGGSDTDPKALLPLARAELFYFHDPAELRDVEMVHEAVGVVKTMEIVSICMIALFLAAIAAQIAAFCYLRHHPQDRGSPFVTRQLGQRRPR